MADPVTLSYARERVRFFARNARDSSMYSTKQIDFVIKTACDEFLRFTKCVKTSSTATISSGSSTFTLPTGFRPERLLVGYLSGSNVYSTIAPYDEYSDSVYLFGQGVVSGPYASRTPTIKIIPIEQLNAMSIAAVQSGQPQYIAFVDSSTAKVYPPASQDYTLNLLWWNPLTDFTEGTIIAATGSITVSAGVVTAVQLLTNGSGYDSTSATVTPSSGNSTYSVTQDVAGTVTAITITSGGTGASTGATIAFNGNADISLNIPEVYVREVLVYGATCLLQQNEPQNGYADRAYQKFHTYMQEVKDANNLGIMELQTRPRHVWGGV